MLARCHPESRTATEGSAVELGQLPIRMIESTVVQKDPQRKADYPLSSQQLPHSLRSLSHTFQTQPSSFQYVAHSFANTRVWGSPSFDFEFSTFDSSHSPFSFHNLTNTLSCNPFSLITIRKCRGCTPGCLEKDANSNVLNRSLLRPSVPGTNIAIRSGNLGGHI